MYELTASMRYYIQLCFFHCEEIMEYVSHENSLNWPDTFEHFLQNGKMVL